MAKLVLAMFMSLDGHIEGPNGEFVGPDWSDDMQTHWSDDTMGKAGLLTGQVAIDNFETIDAIEKMVERLQARRAGR